MRVNAHDLPKHLHGNISVYFNGEKATFGCIIADDHWSLIKRYKVVDGSFIINHKRQEVESEFVRGNVIICNHWEMENKKIK